MVLRWIFGAVLGLIVFEGYDFGDYRSRGLAPGKQCTSLDGIPGRCVKLSRCESLSDIHNTEVLSFRQSERLADSLCGIYRKNPFVCCLDRYPYNVLPETSLQQTLTNQVDLTAEYPLYHAEHSSTTEQLPIFHRNSNSSFDWNTVNFHQFEPAPAYHRLRPQHDPELPNFVTPKPSRIPEDQKISPDEFPWSALIQYRKPYGILGFHCGGSLISDRYVLTAAHCINAIPNTWKVYRVRLGEYDLKNSGPDCAQNTCTDIPLDMDIDRIVIHERYVTRQTSQYNDIALIRLTSQVQLSTFIQPITLATEAIDNKLANPSSTLLSAGWGKSLTASATSVKSKVHLNLDSPGDCSHAYKVSGIKVRDGQLCASEARGTGVCSCDSGGPLMVQQDGRYYLVGVGSFGPAKCGLRAAPGIYTRVVRYAEWIAGNMV